jgi:hypothetical protein
MRDDLKTTQTAFNGSTYALFSITTSNSGEGNGIEIDVIQLFNLCVPHQFYSHSLHIILNYVSIYILTSSCFWKPDN